MTASPTAPIAPTATTHGRRPTGDGQGESDGHKSVTGDTAPTTTPDEAHDNDDNDCIDCIISMFLILDKAHGIDE